MNTDDLLSSSDDLNTYSAGVKHNARTSNRVLSVSKTLSYNSQNPSVLFEQWSDVTYGVQSPLLYLLSSCLIVEPIITLRQTMCFHQSKCFWHRCNVACLFRCEPNSGRTMLTAAVCSVMELRYQVIWIRVLNSAAFSWPTYKTHHPSCNLYTLKNSAKVNQSDSQDKSDNWTAEDRS